MVLRGAKGIESRFAVYVEGLVRVIGHADRAGPLRDYCSGLMMPAERKSVEPMAALTAPGRAAAQHQSLLHFIGQGAWSDAAVLGKVREMVLTSKTMAEVLSGLAAGERVVLHPSDRVAEGMAVVERKVQ
jgi:SRSO17 transposase